MHGWTKGGPPGYWYPPPPPLQQPQMVRSGSQRCSTNVTSSYKTLQVSTVVPDGSEAEQSGILPLKQPANTSDQDEQASGLYWASHRAN